MIANVREVKIVTPYEGATISGFFLRREYVKSSVHGFDSWWLVFRGLEHDYCVPEVYKLSTLHMIKHRKAWFTVKFIKRVSITDDRSIWHVQVFVSDPPHGARGTLRRLGYRL